MSEEKNEAISSNEEMVGTREQSVSASPRKGGKKGLWVVLLLIVAAVVVYALISFGKGGSEGDDIVSDDAEKVVATVYDVTITQAELEEKLEQVKLSMPVGEMDPTEDAAFELQLLQDLVDLELLKRAAEAKNYTITDDQVDAEIATIVEQFPSEEDFYAQLETVGITEEELRENIVTEMHIRQLLEEETDIASIEVTDTEVQELYDASVGDAVDVPPLDAVSDVIRAQLMSQKSAEIVEEYVSGLRESAGDSIDITLE